MKCLKSYALLDSSWIVDPLNAAVIEKLESVITSSSSYSTASYLLANNNRIGHMTIKNIIYSVNTGNRGIYAANSYPNYIEIGMASA